MQAAHHRNPTNALSREALARALFENYESLYDIDAETAAYQCYHESDSFSTLKIESSGDDFFESVAVHLPKAVYKEDQKYVWQMLQKDAMLKALQKEKYYSFVYRLVIDGKPVHHKIRASLETINGRRHILMGVRNVEETVRQEKAHTDAIHSLHQKEKNHLEAILASAWGYFEANLTKDVLLERSPGLFAHGNLLNERDPQPCYSELEKRFCSRLVVQGSGKYMTISDRTYLLNCFDRGERRASVSFSARMDGSVVQPFKAMFHLYQDTVSGDVLVFCVVYDLTEQQRKEKELRELEEQLNMSRIRNSTSQMQPHFLYNALGSIQEIILENPAYASELIGDFTIHLRSCVRAMASDAPIPFKQELDNIHAYVNIEKMRFGDRLRVEYHIDADDFLILPLSIQPLVENAIRHGVYERGAAGGTVTVRSRETENVWIVEVEDNGVGFDVAAFEAAAAAGERDSTGLKNITFRLEKVMNARVVTESTKGVGTKVTVIIPKKEERT